MELSNLDLEKICGGNNPAMFMFTCPYCKCSTDMRLAGQEVTCLRCHRKVLDMNAVNVRDRRKAR